ncbi:MAG: type I restriction enzyme HsdR N-terminal domain-containing protein [Lentimicrobium sp.]|jgi:hypothetical protein|nr:type I restriction enzyme HsdR N-terminal domain-containing protein [Lentimicrobium sp.]
MEQLNFPGFNFNVREEQNGRKYIFDPARKRYVRLTPEEWVRQHLISYLTTVKNIPLTLMAVESGLKVNGLQQRFDLLVFNNTGKAMMIAECKASSVKLSTEAMFQAARYNLSLKVDYLLITNGLDHHCARVDYSTGSLNFLEEIPDYQRLNV